jgi:hypothetical protein
MLGIPWEQGRWYGMIALPVSIQDDNFKTIPGYLFVSSDQFEIFDIFFEIFDIFLLSYQAGIDIHIPSELKNQSL